MNTTNKVSRQFTVQNKLGLHARPASILAKTANEYVADIRISVAESDHEIDAKSIMGVMMLAAEKGTALVINAHGEDAAEAVDALEQLFKQRFGEE